MKNTMKILILALVMVLALCGVAQALTQEDIQGVWEADSETVLGMLGITAEQYESLKAIIGEMAITLEFTADKQYIVEASFGGETDREVIDYELLGNYLILNGGEGMSTLTLEGDKLTIKDPDGTTLTVIRKGAAVPAANDSIVGTWVTDVAKTEAAGGAMPYDIVGVTIVFNADGTASETDHFINGDEETVDFSYTLKDGIVVIEGMECPYVLNGDELTIKATTTMVFNRQVEGVAPAVPAATGDQSVVGVWNLDIEGILQMAGISEDDYEMMKPYLDLMSATMEFTADGRMIMVMNVMGQETVQEEEYEIVGNTIVVEGAPAEYTIVGDTLTITEGEMSLSMTRSTAAPTVDPVAPVDPVVPAAGDGIVGEWAMDIEEMMMLSGMPEEELEEMRPFLSLMSATMEFTADGKVYAHMTAMGQTQTEETTYSVSGNTIIMDGDEGTYSIVGDKLSITIDGETLTLTRK